MSCCPTNSEPALTAPADYTPVGAKTVFPALAADAAIALGLAPQSAPTEAYVVGNSRDETEAVILIPDVWGWDSGRTRAIADTIAAADYKVVVPKLLSPAIDSGTDGDGLAPGYDMAARGGEFWDLGARTGWAWDQVGAKLNAVTAALKAAGVERFVCVGMCYGGWVAAKLSAQDAAVVGIFSPHPSIGVEAKMGGDAFELCKNIQCEVFVAPAGNDPADYDEAGAMFKAFLPGSKTVRYPEMKHGWVPRGDLANEVVKRDVGAVIGQMMEWINAKFAPKTKLM